MITTLRYRVVPFCDLANGAQMFTLVTEYLDAYTGRVERDSRQQLTQDEFDDLRLAIETAHEETSIGDDREEERT